MPNRISGIGIEISYNTTNAQKSSPAQPSSAVTAALDKLDVINNVWSSAAPMLTARGGLAAHVYNDFLFAIGGTDAAQIYPINEQYDIFENKWTSVASMNTPRCFFQSVLHDGFIYCIGGLTSDSFGKTSITPAVERYDIIHNSWTSLADMPSGYSIMMGTAHYIAGKIYVLCGYAGTTANYNNNIVIYDVLSNTWSLGAPLNADELSFYQRLLPFSFVNSSYIYVVDGLYFTQPEPELDANGNVVSTPDPILQYLPDVFRYTSGTGLVERGERFFNDIPRARYSGATVALGNIAYFLGGIDSLSNTLRFVEEVNANFQPFRYVDYSRLPKGRSSFAAAGYSGEYGSDIFVIGGTSSQQSSSFLKVVLDAIPSTVNLDGKQTANVRVTVTDENNESPDEVKVLLQGTGDSSGDVVIFTEDQLIVKNGYALATLQPRADDSFGAMTVNDSTTRSYNVTISGSVVDAVFYGDTDSLSQQPVDNTTGIVVSQTATAKSNITLPSVYTPLYKYDTTVSAAAALPASYLNLGNIGGFLSLQPNFSTGGQDATIKYVSNIRWVPQVLSILETNDADIDTVKSQLDRLSRDDPFGGSPIFDGIYDGANVMTFDSTGDPKMEFLLTDGEEENSHNSLTDTSTELSNTGASSTTLVAAVFRIIPSNLILDQGIRGGSVIEQITDNTSGTTVYVASNDNITTSIEECLKAKGFIGNGTYTFGFDLGDEVVIQSIQANFAVIDPLTNAYWHYSIGDMNNKFTLFTDRLSADEIVDLSGVHGRYINFIIEFEATLDVDAYNATKLIPPKLTSVSIVFHQKTESYIYMTPIQMNADAQQIVVTMDSNRPLGSEILFGVNDALTGNWDDYDTTAIPAVENNNKIVVPLRKSLDASTFTLEQLVSIDGYVFEAQYGQWPQDADVIIYADGTDIVPATTYKLIPQKGRVVFSQKTTDSYVISITNKPILSVAVKVVNRVHGEPVTFAGTGYMFTTSELQPSQTTSLLPTVQNVLITPLQANVNSTFTANYTYEDLSGQLEKNTIITWYINNTVQSDIQNLKTWSNPNYKLAVSGDIIYFTIAPSADAGNGNFVVGTTVRSLPVKLQ